MPKYTITATTISTELGALRAGDEVEMTKEQADHLRSVGVVGGDEQAVRDAAEAVERQRIIKAGADLDMNPVIPNELKGQPVPGTPPSGEAPVRTVDSPDLHNPRAAVDAYHEAEQKRHDRSVAEARRRGPAVTSRSDVAGSASTTEGDTGGAGDEGGTKRRGK